MNITLVIIVTILIILLILISFILRLTYVIRNENPLLWEKKVKKIESRYSDNYPKDSIVFVGSSSIEYWKNLKKDMSPLNVINHGIAGTKVNDITYYADRLIFPYQPQILVFYVGTNDINGIKDNSKTGDDVYHLTIDFFNKIHKWNPDLLIYYISISPSIARKKVWKDANRANELIKEYCEGKDSLRFIDSTNLLIDVEGNLKKGIFKFDGLHFNKKGYAIWTSLLKPILLENIKNVT
jgi:lysophospholipase L1-like esterase